MEKTIFPYSDVGVRIGFWPRAAKLVPARRWLHHSAVIAASLGVVWGQAVLAQETETRITVPSGQPLTLFEQQVVAPENKLLYLGFVAPALAGDYPVTFERASEDMDVICATFGIPLAGKLIGDGMRIDEIVVRLMERAIPYGSVDESAAQFLNAYDISGGICEWY